MIAFNRLKWQFGGKMNEKKGRERPVNHIFAC